MTKSLKLLSIELTHFKGIKSFRLDANGEDVVVYGDNASGKTSVFDAFVWLLFNKNSQNKTDFDIKTLTEAGDHLHGLSHEVEAKFEIDGIKKLTLKKVYAEKWTKKRGSAESTFSGHTTDHFIDEIPKKKKEFDEKVAELIKEDVFKLLTSPTYFNEQLHWQKRRDVLLQVGGDISNDEVVAANKELASLPSILGDRSIEDHRKWLTSQRAGVNAQLDKLPVRIDEVQRSLPDVSGLDESLIAQEIEFLQSQLQEKEDEHSRIRNGSEVSSKENELRLIQGSLIDIKNRLQASAHDEVMKTRREAAQKQDDTDSLEQSLNSKKRLLTSHEETVSTLTKQADTLRDLWTKENQCAFEHEAETECPTCKQELPEDEVAAVTERALSAFNLKKAEKLESISSDGKRKKVTIEESNQAIEKLEAEIAEIEQNWQDAKEQLIEVQARYQTEQKSIPDPNENTEYQEQSKKADEKQAEINELKQSSAGAIEKVLSEIQKFKSEIKVLEVDQSKFTLIENSKTRIAELEAEEKKLAAHYEDLERQLFLTEEFIRTKVQLFEERINSHFQYARFKLFDSQINGGLTETCETLYKGVPYGSNLNDAARINVGLDIINTLSAHYGFYAPIFIDNSESVTKLIKVDSQVIALEVSADHPNLTIGGKKAIKEAV